MKMKKKICKFLCLGLSTIFILSNTFAAQAANKNDLIDVKYYAEQYSDLKAAFGNQDIALRSHYLTYGIKEGRVASQWFNAKKYREKYADLDAAFGDNWSAYFEHYINYGIKEGRDGCGELDVVAYANRYPDLYSAFGYDFAKLKNHYEAYGVAEGRDASGSSKSDSSAQVSAWSAPKQDDVEDEQPTEPSTEAPTEPSTEAPTEPSTEAPTEPSTEAPTEPSTEAPTEPSTEAPTEPSTEAPTEPSTEAPTEPSTETPTEPSTEAPTEPSTEAPTEPSTEAPTEPSTEAPTEPSTEAPTEPSTEAPTEPSTEAPTEPSTEAPTEPSTEAPTEPSTEAPTEPSSEPKKEVDISGITQIGVDTTYHTQEEIKKYMKKYNFSSADFIYSFDNINDWKPIVTGYKLTAPYAPGTVAAESLRKPLNYLNMYRYIAGLSYDIKIKEEYNELAQAASLVNAVNDELTHYPVQPSDMDDELYEKGALGARSSNLGFGYLDLVHTLKGCLDDEDDHNIATVGHRRWILNPYMKYTGFGFVQTRETWYSPHSYSAVYAFDNSDELFARKVYGVAWPAREMPVEYFGNDIPWSYSYGKALEGEVTVTLKCLNEEKENTWYFSEKKADGDFYVENHFYGQPGCVIFRADDITIEAGDVYLVTITNDEETVANYTVRFFE